MKRCSNPNCESSFLYGDSKTTCPFCHAPLTNDNGAASIHQLLTPVDNVFDREPSVNNPTFINHSWRGIECTGRITEIEHQALFYSKYHKIFNTLFRGEPFQLAHQSVEYTIRVEPISDGIPSEVTDFCLYGNYLGCLQVGDEVRVKAKDCRHRRVVRSITNLSTGSPIKPGLQISASVIRVVLLALFLIFLILMYEVVQFVASGVAAAFVIALVSAVMPIIICIVGLWFLFRSVFPSHRGRRR